MKNINNMLVWMDLEMTGLNPESDRIIEIASVITDQKLNIIDKGISIAINQPKHVLDSMDIWNVFQHEKSGLIERVKNSSYSEKEAEEIIKNFIRKYTKTNCSPICGNTVDQDRYFLKKYMPNLESFFHYRNLDVSTIKILMKIWPNRASEGIKKKEKHLALEDIYDSISELKYYKNYVFKL